MLKTWFTWSRGQQQDSSTAVVTEEADSQLPAKKDTDKDKKKEKKDVTKDEKNDDKKEEKKDEKKVEKKDDKKEVTGSEDDEYEYYYDKK